MGYNIKLNIDNPKTKTMEQKNYRIALCGPSGSGKSTLARKISEEYGIPYTENSAGLLLPEEDQNHLVKYYGWTKSGHKDVIKLSHINPEFGWQFQRRLLRVRTQFIKDNPNFVIDRSPIDNVAYFLLQCSAMQPEDLGIQFIEAAREAAQGLTHLIFIPTMLHNPVEDNGSRVANLVYQGMVNAVFSYVVSEFFTHVNILRLDTSSFTQRWIMTQKFLTP